MDTLPTEAKKGNAFTKWAMVIAIMVVLNLFFNYAISLVYKAPQYDDYIKPAQVVEPVITKDDCLKVGGQWTDPDTRYENIPTPGMKSAPAVGYCDVNFTKQKEFNEAQKNYSRTVFILLVVLGVISLGLSAVLANTILSLAFSWGGVLSIIIASIRYWSDADNLFKVIILAMALGALIWLAVKKFSSNK
jgi:hypothetical protein